MNRVNPPQPLPLVRPLTPQSISSSEHRRRSRQLSDASTVYSEPSELFQATERLKVTKVRELLKAGASIDSRDSQGRTLIDVAVTLGARHADQDKMVGMLLLKGAKFTCTDLAAVELFGDIKRTINSVRKRRKLPNPHGLTKSPKITDRQSADRSSRARRPT
jgi:ankyrin repeat protein